MPNSRLKDNIELLNYIEKNGVIALIDAEKIEYLDRDDNWIKLSELGLSTVPIIVYTEKEIDKDNNAITYQINYQLLILKKEITSKRHENIILQIDNLEECEKIYITSENEKYNRASIRYDNRGINTFSKIVDTKVIESILIRQKIKLFKVTTTIDENIKKNNTKKLK